MGCCLLQVTCDLYAAVALLALLLPVSARSAGNTLWQQQSIYQIITDRFYDGDPSNDNADGNYEPGGHRGTSVHGGDFKGIEQKLDYIKSLGATAIWISPVVLNARGEFHGYAGLDFYRVDPHWGTMADLQHLVQAAHARGILVIDDIVVNHGGNLVDSADPDYPEFQISARMDTICASAIPPNNIRRHLISMLPTHSSQICFTTMVTSRTTTIRPSSSWAS